MAWPLADSAGGARQPSESRNGPSYLEGFIDAMYRDTAGLWRIVDYKTNQVTPESLPAVAAHYELQMSVYALAVERILKSSPAELVLCFLRPGLEYQFPWGAAARRRAETQIESAVAASRL
jgi:ATP-dependent exoDNAse (exonuclease V) beta subunit